MQPADWILRLQQIVSPEESRELVKAYLREPLAPRTMQQEGFLDELREKGADWSLADLALSALGSPLKAAELRQVEMIGVEASLRSSALQAYENTHKTLKPAANLAEAGLLAIALRERRRLTNGWNGLMNELNQGALNGQPGLAFQIWKTPLACLLKMTPDGQDLCTALLPRQTSSAGSRWITHMLLANPMPEQERIGLLISLLRKVTPQIQTAWLREMRLSGATELAVEISQAMLTTAKPLAVGTNLPLEDMSSQVDDVLRETLAIQHLVEINRLAGNVEEAAKLLNKVREISQTWLAGIDLMLADLSWQAGNSEQAQTAAAEILALPVGSLDSRAELIFSLGNSWQNRLDGSQVLENPIHPLMQILKAEELGKTGRLAEGQEMARKGLQAWLAWLEEKPFGLVSEYSTDWQAEIFAVALMDLGLSNEAIAFCRAALNIKPADAGLLDILSQIFQSQGENEKALEPVSILANLDPEGINRQRSLAKLLNSTQRWRAAFPVWQRLMTLTRTPQTEDALGLAEAALEGDNPNITIEMCNRVLEQDGNHGQANGMLGRSLVRTGAYREAIPVLCLATASFPETKCYWLVLAEAYRAIGDQQKELETLRAAALAIQDSVEVFLALGESCQQAGLQSEALPAFRKAALLEPDSEQAAIQLGRMLLSLGHLSEANSVVAEAVKRWSENPELAYVQARICLALGDQDTAMQALEIAIQTPKPDVERYILLAETLMEGFHPGSPQPAAGSNRLERASQILQAALTWMPENWMGLVLQGELLLACGENQAAYEIFSHLYENNPGTNQDNYWRLLAGLGQSALRVNQIDMALNSLQEAILHQPERIELHRLLAEAYSHANQRVETIQRARYALKLAANDETNLIWFTELMAAMQETGEAILAMQVLTQIAPERPDYWLKRACLEVENGDLEAAQQSLQTMLALSELKHEHYRLAALTYLRMQDEVAAMACLDLATSQFSDLSTDLLLEMTCLNFRLGRLEMALESCLRVSVAFPNDGILQILQADLLCGLDRWQHALQSLDRALEIWEKGHRTGELGRWQRIANSGWIREDWLVSANRLGMISLRKALIYQRIHERDLAEQHLEIALQQMDQCLSALYLGAEMAIGEGDAIRCQEYLEKAGAISPEWIGLQIEKTLLEGNEERASEMLRQAMIDAPRDFRLRELQISFLSQRFDWNAANGLFDRLLVDYKERKTSANHWPITQPELLASLMLRGDLLRLVNIALELRRWQEALDLANECVQVVGDPAAHLQLARTLVICAEQQRLYEQLNISAHAPGKQILAEARFKQFLGAMEKAGLESHLTENQDWFQRGLAVFQNELEQSTTWLGHVRQPVEVAAGMAAKRRMGDLAGAVELANLFPQEPVVLAELVLVKLNNDPQDALMTAKHLAEISPVDPVHLAILALIAARNQDWSAALAALENALQIWPDEAEWHAWAAEMAEKVKAGRVCQAHWEQAVMLEPNRLAYALSLGRTYNNHQVFNKAASILRRAVEITTTHPEIWMELARALQGTGEFAEALECAGKAAEILPEDTRPLLLSGQIALSMGKLDWALVYAQEAYKISNQDEKVILFLVRVMEKRGKPADGLALIEKSLVNLDQSEMLVFEQARLLHRIQGPKAAMPVLNRLSKAQPSSVEALSLMAQVQADCGDLVAAEQSARKALEVNPDDPQTNLLLGSLLHKAGQLDQAVAYLKLATTEAECTMEALMELGRVYQSRREFQQAMQSYQQAILMAPKDHRPYLAAGAVLREAKDYRGSEAMFRRAAELAPEDINIQRQLGAVVALNLVYDTQEVKFSYER